METKLEMHNKHVKQPKMKQLWPDKELHKDTMKKVYARGIDSYSDEYFCAEVEGKIIGFCSLAIKNSLWQEGYIGHVNALTIVPFYHYYYRDINAPLPDRQYNNTVIAKKYPERK